MSILQKALFRATGNRLMQKLLEKSMRTSQELMGIGSGSGVLSSGEQAIFHALERRKRPPYCIFDVGSNKGQFLQLLSQSLATRDFTVHCFEPGAETFRILSDMAAGDHRVTLNNLALGRTKGVEELHYDTAGSGLASLTRRRLDHFNIDFGMSEQIRIDTIDNYCKDHSIDHVHLLKIDIEGHEIDALAGAKGMFSRNAIDMVTFEFGGCNIDTRTFFQDFWYFFKEAGYSLYRITPSGYMHPVRVYREIYEQFRTTNFMAISNTE